MLKTVHRSLLQGYSKSLLASSEKTKNQTKNFDFFDFLKSLVRFTPMSGRFQNHIVVGFSSLKRFGDYSRTRDENREKSNFFRQNRQIGCPLPMKNGSKNSQKIDFFKSCQTLSPIQGRFRNHITVCFSSPKGFGD